MTHIPLCTKGVLAPAYQWGIVGAEKDYSGLEWILAQLRIVSESSIGSQGRLQQRGVQWPGLPYGPKTDRDSA